MGGLGSNGGKDLEDLCVSLSVDELCGSLCGGGKVLLDEDGGLLRDEGLSADLSSLKEDGLTSGGLEVVGEESADLSDYGGGILVLTDLCLELVVLLLSLSVEGRNLKLVALDFLLLLVHDALDDLSLGVQGSLQLSLKLDLHGVGLSQVLIEHTDVHVTSILEVTVVSIILSLLGNVLVLQVTQGTKKSVKGLTGLHLKPDGVEQSSSEGRGVNLLDQLNNL